MRPTRPHREPFLRGQPAAPLLAALLLLASGKATAGLKLSGYYEHTLEIDYTEEGGETVLDASKVRLDFRAGEKGSPAVFRGNVNYIQYHSDASLDIAPYLPDAIVEEMQDAHVSTKVPLGESRIDLDNAFLSWSRGGIAIRAGKQQISWGAGYALNPTDLFQAKNPLDPTYEKEGVTAIRFDARWGIGGDLALIAAPGDDFERGNYAGRLAYHIGAIGYDAALTVHRVSDTTSVDPKYFFPRRQRREAVGLEFSGPLFGLGAWAEGNVNRMEMEEDFARVVAGFDYTFAGGLYFMIEGMYNGRAEERPPYPMHDWIAELAYGEPVTPGWVLEGVRKFFGPLVECSLYLFESIDGSTLANPRLDISVAENLDLSLYGGATFGNPDGAFPPGVYSFVARGTVSF